MAQSQEKYTITERETLYVFFPLKQIHPIRSFKSFLRLGSFLTGQTLTANYQPRVLNSHFYPIALQSHQPFIAFWSAYMIWSLVSPPPFSTITFADIFCVGSELQIRQGGGGGKEEEVEEEERRTRRYQILTT